MCNVRVLYAKFAGESWPMADFVLAETIVLAGTAGDDGTGRNLT